jgi:hypothetical protein
MAETQDTRTTDELALELEGLLRELVVRYEQMLTLSQMRHDAIRAADAERLGACVQQENGFIQEIADIEKRRIGVVGAFAERLGAEPKEVTTMTWIAERLADPMRGRLLRLAQSLRGLLGKVRAENEVGAAAATALSQHMTGLLRQVAQCLNHAKTYGRGGQVGAGPSIVSAVDLTS